jgi:hypothetical protein
MEQAQRVKSTIFEGCSWHPLPLAKIISGYSQEVAEWVFRISCSLWHLLWRVWGTPYCWNSVQMPQLRKLCKWLCETNSPVVHIYQFSTFFGSHINQDLCSKCNLNLASLHDTSHIFLNIRIASSKLKKIKPFQFIPPVGTRVFLLSQSQHSLLIYRPWALFLTRGTAGNFHPGIICAECGKYPVKGIRLRCFNCHKDICQVCCFLSFFLLVGSLVSNAL